MIDKSKRITLSVCLNVSITVDAEEQHGEVNVVRVVGINGLPGPREVMEALGADDGLDQLDEAYENAAGGAA